MIWADFSADVDPHQVAIVAHSQASLTPWYQTAGTPIRSVMAWLWPCYFELSGMLNSETLEGCVRGLAVESGGQDWRSDNILESVKPQDNVTREGEMAAT